LDFIANFDWFLVLVISAIGIGARYLAAYLGSKWSGQSKSNLSVIAISHTPGGQMHIVVAMLAYSSGLISEKVLVSIIAAAIISTIVFGPWLSQTVRKLKRSIFDILFDEDDVYIDSESSTRDEMLRYMSSIVARKTKISRDTIYHEIKLREEQMSTAMGGSIAIPHARLENLEKSFVFAFHTRQGLEWDSPDGNLVRLIVLVITPKESPNAQLQILQGIAGAMQDHQKARNLVTSRDRRFVWATIRSELNACQQCNVEV
jgi:mannitol/fructose-specific phosphotransferase system IIA component (Ntr-type)